MSDIPWLCAGDFNEVLDMSEKWGGRDRNLNQITSFKQAIDDACLRDMGFVGNPYTWSKGRLYATRILERLDRAFATGH